MLVAAMWAELDVKGKALLRAWNETFGPNGYMKKRRYNS